MSTHVRFSINYKLNIMLVKHLAKINSATWEFFHEFLKSADFFQNQLYRKIISGIPSDCQTVWIQIRPDILIWFQTVCKNYQQTTLRELIWILPSAIFFKINFIRKLIQEYHRSDKQFGSKSGPIFCRAWSESKLFAKIISRRLSEN